MKMKLKRAAALLSAAAAAAMTLNCAMAYSGKAGDTIYTDDNSYDYPYEYPDFEYPYDPEPYDPSDTPVSGRASKAEINPDNGEYLIFTVTNSSGREITVSDPVSEGTLQRYNGDSWIYVNGGEPAAVPYYDEYDDGYYLYEDSETIPPYSSYSDKMYAGDLEDGDYRLVFYASGYYRPCYIYFSVRRSVSALLPQKKIFEGDDVLTVRVKNNLSVPAAIALDTDLSTLERYTGGKWREVESIYDESYDYPELNASDTADYRFPLKNYGDLEAGRYRLTFGWSCGDELPLDYPDSLYGSVTLNFSIQEPVSMKVIPTSNSKASDMYISVKITNNTDRKVTASDYGRLYKKQGTKWVKVQYKKRAKEISGYKTIAPNDTEVIRIYFSDYYNTRALRDGSYRIEVPVDGETYLIDFRIVKDVYYVVK